MQIEFAWDEKKNAINQKKHDVSFEEAKTCFEDEYATLVVIFTEWNGLNPNVLVNRIISARKATKKEFQYYWNARKGECL